MFSEDEVILTGLVVTSMAKKKHSNCSPTWKCVIFLELNRILQIVLMAIANSNYEFVLFDIRSKGRISDSGVINSRLHHFTKHQWKVN
jgi:predicted transcriptional regulator